MGIDVNRFATRPCEDLLCKVCRQVLKNPVAMPCDHCVCAECISSLETLDYDQGCMACPLCHENFRLSSLQAPRLILTTVLQSLPMKCENASRGCTDLVYIEHLADHACAFAPVDCPYPGCAYAADTAEYLNHQDLSSHHATCEWRCLHCSYDCGAAFPATYRDAHESQCSHRTVICPNLCGAVGVPLNDLDLHMATVCPSAVIDCPVEGCVFAAERGNRDLWAVHVDSQRETHFDFLLAQLRTMDTAVAHLSQVIQKKDNQAKAAEETHKRELARANSDLSRTRQQMASLTKTKDKQLSMQSVLLTNMLEENNNRTTETTTAPPSRVTATVATRPTALMSTRKRPLPDDISTVSNSPVSSPISVVGESPAKRPRYWKQFDEMDVARHGCAAVYDGKGSVVVVGGFNDHGALASASMFDVQTKVWTTLPEMTTPRSWCAAVHFLNRLFVVGGCDAAGNCLNTVEMYDFQRRQWCLLPPMRQAREGCAAVVIGRSLFVIGGFDGHTYSDQVEVLDFNGMQWRTLPAMISRRGACTACYSETTKQLFVFGGCDGTHALDTAEALDLRTMQWSPIAAMTSRRVGAASVIDPPNRRIIVVGGGNGGQYHSSCECFDMDTNAWRVLPPMSTERLGTTAVNIDGKLLVIGGSRSLTDRVSFIEECDLFFKKK